MSNQSISTAGRATKHAGAKIVIRLPMPVPDAMLARMTAAFPEAAFVSCPSDQDMSEHLSDVEAIIGSIGVTSEIVRNAPKLRWVQALGVGVEKFLDPCINERGIQVANARGVNVANLAEHALAMMLAFARGLPELQRRQAQAKWLPGNGPMLPTLFELNGTRLCLIGYGEISRAIARLARAIDMEVWAMRRTPNAESDQHAHRILGPDGLDEMLRTADHLMLILPLTADTQGMIGKEEFAKMKSSAYLYNMGRGGLIDQGAMVEALRDGRVAGAGLDATTPEPLPSNSPLWAMPNTLITAHTAGNTPRFFERVIELVAENLRRFRDDEPLLNTVNTRAGY